MKRSDRVQAAVNAVNLLSSRLENCECHVAGQLAMLYSAMRSREAVQQALTSARVELNKLNSTKVAKR